MFKDQYQNYIYFKSNNNRCFYCIAYMAQFNILFSWSITYVPVFLVIMFVLKVFWLTHSYFNTETHGNRNSHGFSLCEKYHIQTNKTNTATQKWPHGEGLAQDLASHPSSDSCFHKYVCSQCQWLFFVCISVSETM